MFSGLAVPITVWVPVSPAALELQVFFASEPNQRTHPTFADADIFLELRGTERQRAAF